MKYLKWLILSVLLLCSTPANAEIDTFVGIESIDTFVGVESIDEAVGVTIASGGSDCPSGSSYLSAWGGNYPSDTDKICYNSQASQKDGSSNGTFGVGTDYGEGGGDIGIQINAADEGYRWVVATDDLLDDTVGTICVRCEMQALTGNTQIVEFSFNSSNVASIYILSDGRVRGLYRGNGSGENVTEAGPISTSTWTTLKYTWDDTNDNHKICLGTDANPTDCTEDTGDTLTPFSTAVDTLTAGEFEYGLDMTDEFHITYIKVYSTYDATCE